MQLIKQNKPRLFVDMDGTIAEWRNIKITIDSSEVVSDVVKTLDGVLNLPGYFRTLKPYQNVVDAIRKTVRDGQIEVFVLTCVRPDTKGSSPKKDKNDWLDDYLPEIDKSHRILVPDGENKTIYIPGGIRSSDFLLDDYSKNLRDWQSALLSETNAIKLLNNVNESKGTWSGNSIAYDAPSEELRYALVNIIHHAAEVIHRSPRKDNFSTKHIDFIDQYAHFSMQNNVAVYKKGERLPESVRFKIDEEKWKRIEFGHGDDTHFVCYKSLEDLEKELSDAAVGRSQGVIPDEIAPQIKGFLENTEKNTFDGPEQ